MTEKRDTYIEKLGVCKKIELIEKYIERLDNKLDNLQDTIPNSFNIETKQYSKEFIDKFNLLSKKILIKERELRELKAELDYLNFLQTDTPVEV